MNPSRKSPSQEHLYGHRQKDALKAAPKRASARKCRWDTHGATSALERDDALTASSCVDNETKATRRVLRRSARLMKKRLAKVEELQTKE
ncbi:hypothetical protein KIN20_004706 [Parelaphostrongylus tenuis]|uniref:Uncharacterized protein n=1 Tax=Parelaphostrongylus tenuis TaxID=148309 RepID=A0AAD5LYX8_PARTN|nr:hypothetical protein KIN20_004706 [Parelaphostrongylus tenuis]